MAEPTSSGASIGLAAVMVALLGPAAGEYAAILFAALAGSLWPLAVAEGVSRSQGALLVIRLVLTSVALTGVLAWAIEHHWSVPVTTSIAPVAFFVAALGDHWRSLIAAVAARARRVIGGRKA